MLNVRNRTSASPAGTQSFSAIKAVTDNKDPTWHRAFFTGTSTHSYLSSVIAEDTKIQLITAAVSNSHFQVKLGKSQTDFSGYKFFFFSSILFKDFMQGRWHSSTARSHRHSELRTDPSTNDTARTIVDSSRPTSTTTPVTSNLTNRDIDHLSGFCDSTSLILRPFPDTWLDYQHLILIF